MKMILMMAKRTTLSVVLTSVFRNKKVVLLKERHTIAHAARDMQYHFVAHL
jgi:hypothetical protein